MEMIDAIRMFSALSQDTRLKAVRLLVRAGPDGLAAGVIAERLGVSPSTLSHHLHALENAGLVRSARSTRHIIYAANIEGLRKLVAFITEDCCLGNPEICGGLSALKAFCET
ncbi:MAG: metalloregulator ArsR/SmtB family transcription factor [Gammaproteobacteria bacterium]|nr:metalloregulator ArsR/SmtB family transcription factor [Gammaproteobacteria bacterium]